MEKSDSSSQKEDYIGYDLAGYPFNRKYPPNEDKNGNVYYGYPTKGEGVLLYDFAVMGYDVVFSYKGRKYYLLNTGEGVVSDEHYRERRVVYSTPMALIEQFVIDGKSLLELAPNLDDIEPV